MTETIESFVRRRNRYRTLQHQALLTACVCVLFALNVGIIYGALGGARDSYGGTALLATIFVGLLPLGLWFVFTTTFYAFARLLGARAQFSIFLRSVGYGMGAFVPASALWAVGRYLGLPANRGCDFAAFDCDPSTVVSLGDQIGALSAYYTAPTSTTVFAVLYVAGVACVVGGAYYWTVAIDESSTLTRQGATLVVGLPVACFLAVLTLLTF